MVIWRPPSRPRRPPFALGVQGVAKEAAAVALRAGKPTRERSISRSAHPASAREGFARWDRARIFGKEWIRRGGETERRNPPHVPLPCALTHPTDAPRAARRFPLRKGGLDGLVGPVLFMVSSLRFACLYVSSLPLLVLSPLLKVESCLPCSLLLCFQPCSLLLCFYPCSFGP